MPKTIISCNVGTILFTIDCLHNSSNHTRWTDIGHFQWHVGQDVMQELKEPMLAHHQILLQDWYTKINFGLTIYHDSSVTNGIDKIVIRHVQVVCWIPSVCSSTNANPNFAAHHYSYTGEIAFIGRFIIFLPWTPTDTIAQTIHTYLILAHDSLCHAALVHGLHLPPGAFSSHLPFSSELYPLNRACSMNLFCHL